MIIHQDAQTHETQPAFRVLNLCRMLNNSEELAESINDAHTNYTVFATNRVFLRQILFKHTSSLTQGLFNYEFFRNFRHFNFKVSL